MAVTLYAHALLDLGEAKTAIKAGPTFGEDGTLIMFINAATDLVELVGGRVIGARAIVETFDGDGGTRKMLRHSPVLTGGTPSRDPAVIRCKGGSALAASYVILDPLLGIIYLSGTYFEVGIQNCSIAYWAGYDTLPSWAKTAAAIILARFWKLRDKSLETVSSVSANGQTITFKTDAIPGEALALIPRRARFA